MINKDLIKQQNEGIMQKMADALQNNDVEGAADALQSFQNSVAERIEAEFEQYKNVTDMGVLQQRGLRVLTSEENDFYQKFIEAVKMEDNHGIGNLTNALPVTIVDRVIEDMQKEHPLLSAITLQNAYGQTKLVMNAIQMSGLLGKWGQITSAITQEVAGNIKTVDVTTSKYTAFFLIPKDFVKFNFGFAPMWVDQYIRIVLAEVVANGLERTIISGNGKDQFIGMTMDISSTNNGAYSQKEAVALADWDAAYRDIIAGLAIDSNGDYRNIPEVLLVVNPIDYIKKLRRAKKTSIDVDVLDMINSSYPTRVVTSVFMPVGKAAVGIAKNYFAGINGGNSGTIEYSDEYQFLEDNRVYTVREYGHGQPIDNTSFAYLDISDVAPYGLPVEMVSGSDTNPLTRVYTEDDLTAMTVDQIKAVATLRGYTITKSVKAEVIAEFLAQQN